MHSRYQRRLRDTPISGRGLEIRLEVRRFYCENHTCSKTTFTEQVAGLTSPWARRTPGLRSSLEAIGLALAGNAGARLAGRLGIRTGRNSLLRLVRALPDPEIEQVRVLGIDDFAFRRGHTYGTILIDMTTRRPIDLLDTREAAPVRAWLQAHPGVEVICRDRSSSYAEAARTAAPDAIQVADRYHLWANLVGAVEECIMRHRSALAEPLLEPAAPEPEPSGDDEAEPGDPEGKMADNRRARHRQVHDLLAEGHSIRAITRHLGWSRNTVRRYANAERWQDMVTKHRPRPSKLDPYKPYLHAEWQTGRANVVALDREIRAMGYAGSYSIVADYLTQFRPGNAGANDAADHITVFGAALTQIPAAWRRRIIVRIDGAGASHALLEHFSALNTGWRRVYYTVGWAMRAAEETAIGALPEAAWTEAARTDGDVQHGYWVAELTALATKPGWPADMRLIARRVRPSRRQIKNMTDFERATGWVYSVQATNIGHSGIGRLAGTGTVQFLDVLHRHHAVVEDRVRTGKACGLRGLPSQSWAVNASWILAANIAADLDTWLRLLALHDQPGLADAEITAMRHRLYALPARLARHARRRALRLAKDWPWAAAFALCWKRIGAITPLPT